VASLERFHVAAGQMPLMLFLTSTLVCFKFLAMGSSDGLSYVCSVYLTSVGL